MMTWSRQLLTLLTVVVGHLVDGEFICSGDGFQCSSCNTLAYCSNDKMHMEFSCPPDQWCSSPGGCFTLENEQLKECKCTSSRGFMADPFNTQKYIMCVGEGSQTNLTCPEGKAFNVKTSCCEKQPPLECNRTGFFPVLPSCTSHYSCIPDGSGGYTAAGLTKCTETDFVFDTASLECVNKTTIQVSPEPTCPSGDLVAALDSLECNAFHLCQEGTVISGPICCPVEGQVFNVDSMICEENTEQVECPSINPCDDQEYTYKCNRTQMLSE
ncbi:uncharacterized protein LOC121854379 [Homarus americanus]|uniref:Putative Chitin binding Peritrophin-A domain-containing protein 33 n=1 Tax=Homarus americanus TaxID=6706 RepID=A0A8J5TJA9_HOMAM|nr:uncharacterized protein LOC121854379 [Homarus americanus]KAG7176026.1 putative Chitin binding Peritrophin-A domain-containing protein 33 [Homarus americanus]